MDNSGNRLERVNRRELLKTFLPFGKVTLDSAQCTGCGLCAFNCPTEALTQSSEDAEAYKLLFRRDSCDACGRCIEACPEKCLQLEHVLEMNTVDAAAIVLFEDKVARCAQCGSVIGTKATMERLQSKIRASGKTIAQPLELCPDCKVKTGLRF